MFYKVMWNNMVIDLLTEICYIRFLPIQKRPVITDKYSANGIMGSDKDTIYHLYGTPNTFETELKTVTVEPISKEEYETLQTQVAYQRTQQEELQNRVSALEELVNKQNSLLEQLLIKLG